MLFNLGFEGDEPLRQGRPDSLFGDKGEVFGRPGVAAVLFWDVSTEDLTLLDACGFGSRGLFPLSPVVLAEEPQVLVAEDARFSILSAGALNVEACPVTTELLTELNDVRGRGIELLFESPLIPRDDVFEIDTEEELFNVVSPLVSFSTAFVLSAIC